MVINHVSKSWGPILQKTPEKPGVDPQSSEGKKPSIDLVELPRLSVNFKSLRKGPFGLGECNFLLLLLVWKPWFFGTVCIKSTNTYYRLSVLLFFYLVGFLFGFGRFGVIF